MPQVAGHKIVSSCGVGALKELIVVRVTGCIDLHPWSDYMTPVSDELEELSAKAFSDLQFGPGQDDPVFVENGGRDVKPRWRGDRNQQYRTFEPLGF
jgi:hypothetical protein